MMNRVLLIIQTGYIAFKKNVKQFITLELNVLDIT